MTYKVCSVGKTPAYDSLPVAKVVTYPLEQRDYKPFAQNILCVSDTHLHLRMWAFEVNPLPASRLECVMYMFAKAPDTALAVVTVPAGDNLDLMGCCLLKNGGELPVSAFIESKLQEIKLHPHNGEDLQGVYWGYTIDIPISLLEAWSGKTLLSPGDKFPGNFYKICAGTPAHQGCFAPADFTGNPYLPPSMAEFEVLGY